MFKNHSHDKKLIRDLFTQQIVSFYEDIFRYLLHLGADETLAEDMAQEVMVKAWENKEKLLNVEYQKPWLLRVSYNNYISYRRLAQHKYLYSLSDFDLPEWECKHAEQDILTILANDEFCQIMQLALDRLDKKYSEPIRLRYFGELSYKEIAEILQINQNTMRSIISRGLQKLKPILKDLDA